MIIPENFGNCRFIFSCSGVSDPMGFSIGINGAPAWDPVDAAAALYTAWTGIFAPSPETMYLGWTFNGVSVTKTVGGAPVVGEFLENVVGSTAIAGLVVNTGYLVRKLTSSGGRKNRGRFYPPPFNLGEVEVEASGTINATTVSNAQGQYEDLHAVADTAGYPFWLLHSDPADAPTPISGFAVQGKVATQRRRLR